MSGLTSSSSSSLDLPVTMKSSANRITLTLARVPRRVLLGVAFAQQAFEAVEGQVGKDGRASGHLAACPCSVGWRGVRSRYPALQPLLEDGSCPWDVGQQPGVADAVEAGFDVAFQDPLGANGVWPSAMKHCSMASAGDRSCAEPVGVRIGGRFRDRVEGEQVEGLHRPVGHRGDAEGAHLACSVLGMYTRRSG